MQQNMVILCVCVCVCMALVNGDVLMQRNGLLKHYNSKSSHASPIKGNSFE